ncbi:RNA polymerase sigma factor [Flavobacterium sp. HJJ]|uniref:RNA polymerase sigma factor n=1 Tax=Flavobacterium sp. HJJ TaxID=2783792 RepID=UPI001E5071BC|nr:DUF6596 domain-containing protein [Flavobacterium sp. HJJ]
MTIINEKNKDKLIPNLFRKESVKMTAVLCRHFGLQHIEVAEDIVSDTFLKASESWFINGIPENPKAWLYTVAKNKTKDYLKHNRVFEENVKPQIISKDSEINEDFEFNDESIIDSQLAMIFAVCNPINSKETQISLALQILCGFSVEEIVNAFLSKTETIKKRLHRGRAALRKDNFKIKIVEEPEIVARIETVLETLYLLFNEGYYSKNKDQLIRKELCCEAIRLTLILTENQLTNLPKTNALLALMCYQSSRLDTRKNENDEIILFEYQNIDLWDKALIEKGNIYLTNAYKGNEISKYHFEAGIAYWHTTKNTNENKWEHILKLYNQLLLFEYSPMAALNRTFAFSKVYGSEKALIDAKKINLLENNYYHSLLGYLYKNDNKAMAVKHFEIAIRLTKNKFEKQVLTEQIKKIKFD